MAINTGVPKGATLPGSPNIGVPKGATGSAPAPSHVNTGIPK